VHPFLSVLRCCGIQGSCKDGDACQYAHGVFEVWLHPSRFRTELCKDGPSCTRKVRARASPCMAGSSQFDGSESVAVPVAFQACAHDAQMKFGRA
jgi:hypothetical protein